MEQVPNWLNEAVLAAGMATAYNADDWKRIVENPPMGTLDSSCLDFTQIPH